LLLIVVFCYIVERNLKLLFYYKCKISTKNQWLRSTLDKLQNGLLILDKENLHFCNEYFNKNLNFLLELKYKPKVNDNNATFNMNNNVANSFVTDRKLINSNTRRNETNFFVTSEEHNMNLKNNPKFSLQIKRHDSNIKIYETYYLNKNLFTDLEVNPELNC
jgi:hypothetical protein